MADWGWNLVSVIGAAIVAFLTAGRLRRQHAGELYLIWYINSLFFLLFLALEIVAAKNGAPLTRVCGPYEAICASIHDYLTNARDELILVGAIVGVFIGPQLLTYLLAGISGAAIAPKFVWHIEQFVVWSLIKFIAALAGILSATPFAKLLTQRPFEISAFLPGLILITTAFGGAAAHFGLQAKREAVSRQLVGPKPSWPIRQAVRLHNYFTRNAREG
ncbi:hypothetical protein [Bradyrhizobium sp. BR13661]|jgi:hypothetical protein|uniref:hypothetical protein n=1 Tax=Bradyrhizobium sp. BR13661 TaxID=2940622 RepID=UPI002473FDD6|nr:hypothetical protein [Bradyrhizobium sp. BR13661]MDH6258863.1 hypothetical protein [Bradyrhizobium sp. BR13661]